MKKLTVAKYNYDSLPDDWKKDHPVNPFEGVSFMFVGEVANMPGHGFCINMQSGAPTVLHLENLVPDKDDIIIEL